MMRRAMPSRFRPTNLFRIPEDSCSDDGTGIGPVAWVAILREGCLLVDIGEEQVPHEVVETAQGLLWQSPHPGWNEYSVAGAQWKGLRYYIQEEERSWTFACVYNSQQFSKTDCAAWVMEIVEWTATVRQADTDWVEGGHHACQTLFAPLLQERLQRLATPNYDNTISEEDETEEDIEEAAFFMENQRRPLTLLGPPKPENLMRGSVNETLVEIYESDDEVADENEHPPLFDPPPIELRTSLSLCSIPEEQDSFEGDSFEDEIEDLVEPESRVQSIWETTLADITPSDSEEDNTEKQKVVYCTEHTPLRDEQECKQQNKSVVTAENLQPVVENPPTTADDDSYRKPAEAAPTSLQARGLDEPTASQDPNVEERQPVVVENPSVDTITNDSITKISPTSPGSKNKSSVTFADPPVQVQMSPPSSKSKAIVSFADPPVEDTRTSPPTSPSSKNKSTVTFADLIVKEHTQTHDSYKSPKTSPSTSPARNSRLSPKSAVTFADPPVEEPVVVKSPTNDSYRSPKISPNTSPARSKRASPGSKLSPLRRKETVQELVERLARKQAEKENSIAATKEEKQTNDVDKAEEKQNECPTSETTAPKNLEPTVEEKEVKNSDSESLTSTTVEEEEEFDGVPEYQQKRAEEKKCLCWMPSPLPSSKNVLL